MVAMRSAMSPESVSSLRANIAISLMALDCSLSRKSCSKRGRSSAMSRSRMTNSSVRPATLLVSMSTTRAVQTPAYAVMAPMSACSIPERCRRAEVA